MIIILTIVNNELSRYLLFSNYLLVAKNVMFPPPNEETHCMSGINSDNWRISYIFSSIFNRLNYILILYFIWNCEICNAEKKNGQRSVILP